MEVGGQRHTPAVLTLGRTRYPLYSRLGGHYSRSEQVRKISPPHRDLIPGPSRRYSESLYRLDGILALLKIVTSKMKTFASVVLKTAR
jgi:hypothetical protein